MFHLTFAASFSVNQNAEIAIGSKTGTLVGTAAINAGVLEILDDTAGWLEYSAIANADSPQVGTILFKFTPNFNDYGTYGQGLFYTSKGEGDQTNQINLAILDGGSGGAILLQANDSANSAIFSATMPAYPFVLGTTYTIQINYDFTLGSTRILINGSQHGDTQLSTGVRDTDINMFRFGCGWDAYSSSPSNFTLDDICIFKTVQEPIDDYIVGIQFDNPDDLTTLVRLYGSIYDHNKAVEGVEIKIRPYEAGFCNPAITGTGIFQYYAWVSTETTFDGYFELDVYKQPTGKKWELKIGVQSYSFELPDQASVDISTLTLTPIII